jgi:hypothetical protein
MAISAAASSAITWPIKYIEAQLKTGEFPYIEKLLAGRSPLAFIQDTYADLATDERFERGLERILDGVALEIERRR